MAGTKKLVSIIIPCINEEKNINRTLDGLLELTKNHKYDFEFIVINDGSKDKTWEVVDDYSKKYPNVIGINFMTTFGQSAGYQAGFDVSRGDYVITLSADLEIPLENIDKVISLLDEDYDFVNTNRVGRWGGGAERAAKSEMANRLISYVSGVHMNDRGSGLKGFKRVLIENLRLYGEMHRFIPDFLTVYGANMTEIDVEFKDRDYGASAYKGQKRSIKVLLDIVTLAFLLYFAKKPFRAMPGRLFGFTGAIIAGLGVAVTAYMLFLKLLGESIGNRPLFVLAILMIVVGIQSMMVGMIGELMLRVYFEASGRKTYVIRRRTN